MTNLKDNLCQLYNEYCIKGVMIISRSDFERETERICIQTTPSKLSKEERKDKAGKEYSKALEPAWKEFYKARDSAYQKLQTEMQKIDEENENV